MKIWILAFLLVLPVVSATSSNSLIDKEWGLFAINAPYAWAHLPADHPRAVIAVVDTGSDWKSGDLSNVIINISGVRGFDLTQYGTVANCLNSELFTHNCKYVDVPPDELVGPMDFSGHGTHVSGICCADGKGLGIIGVSDARVIPIKVLVSGNTALNNVEIAADGINLATELHVQIISLSLGTYVDNSRLHMAVNNAISSGILVVAAAGNDGTDRPLYPCAYDGVLCVSAINETLQPTSWSNYGNDISVAAPGQYILSDGSRWYSCFSLCYRNETTILMSGTSMATPFVSGSAALLWEMHPQLPPILIGEILKKSATNNGTWNPHTGYGIINLKTAVNSLP